MNIRLGELKIKEPFSLGDLKLKNVTVNGGGYERGYEAGYEKGNTEGYNQGQTEGYNNGYDEGYSEGALPMYYNKVFNFSNVEFPEGYELTVHVKFLNNAGSIIQNAKNLKRFKLISDEPNTIGCAHAFRCESLEVLDWTEANLSFADCIYSFYDAKQLRSILGELDFSPISSSNSTTQGFGGCKALEDISFVTESIKASIDLASCSKLTKASITSIINGLSPDSTEQKLTLSKTAVNKAFETSEGANDGSTSTEWETLVATKPNWTIQFSA